MPLVNYCETPASPADCSDLSFPMVIARPSGNEVPKRLVDYSSSSDEDIICILEFYCAFLSFQTL